MSRNSTTSALVDGILKCVVAGSVLSAAILAPNLIQVLDRPTRKYFEKLDRRAQDRELRRLTVYMRREGLLTETYQHGLAISEAGKRRVRKVDFDNLEIAHTAQWDKRWRLVLFDIPETHGIGRRMLTLKLKYLGLQLLQQSVWIYPYPCRKEISTVCEHYGLSKYVTYIVTTHIDHEELLIQRFSSVLRLK